MNAIEAMKRETEFPVVITDQQGFITYVNECFTTVFGWSLAEIQGQMITVIIPIDFHDSHHLGFSSFLSTQHSTILNHPLRLKGMTKAGQEIEAEHTIMAERDRNEWVFMATLKPM